MAASDNISEPQFGKFGNHGYNIEPAGFRHDGRPTFSFNQIGHATAEWNRRGGSSAGLAYPTLSSRDDISAAPYRKKKA